VARTTGTAGKVKKKTNVEKIQGRDQTGTQHPSQERQCGVKKKGGGALGDMRGRRETRVIRETIFKEAATGHHFMLGKPQCKKKKKKGTSPSTPGRRRR